MVTSGRSWPILKVMSSAWRKVGDKRATRDHPAWALRSTCRKYHNRSGSRITTDTVRMLLPSPTSTIRGKGMTENGREGRQMADRAAIFPIFGIPVPVAKHSVSISWNHAVHTS